MSFVSTALTVGAAICVSITISFVVASEAALPAASVAETATSLLPSLSGVKGAEPSTGSAVSVFSSHSPCALASTSKVAPPTVTITVEPASAVPVRVGVVSFVSTALTVGAAISASTVSSVGALVLPAGSTCVAVITASCGIDGSSGSMDHRPVIGSTGAVNVTSGSPYVIVTVAPGSPAPDNDVPSVGSMLGLSGGVASKFSVAAGSVCARPFLSVCVAVISPFGSGSVLV